MYLHSKYINYISATLIFWVAIFHPNKLYAQVNSIHPLYPAFNGNVLRDDEQQMNPNQPQSPVPKKNNNTVQVSPVYPAPQGNILRDDDRRTNQNQPSLSPPIRIPQGNVLRDDERQSNQTQLPWILISNQPNQAVPSTVTNTISGFLTKEGLTPISCSTNPVVIISINNKYIACSSPTIKFPPGTYNTTIRDLDAAQR
ncbi:hypothetical protein NIES2119_13700 [[Phormidium ambiguum] IAM M-71]|uniref:Uncharacterized protein n=1 Tax=[Phormidium ambiguum] IAM M-71 TaxID=454136 RepID=A0A1U7IJA9_9CYAN|nr:hypothetical protein [Phormidium ambiguum]OKH37304.1 hypothetical protein NIES2119_13700 [Phormidium ambiguum IAM M-71]